MYVGSVYFPPENSSFGRDHTRDVWDPLEREIEYFSVESNVILFGDLNIRTDTLADYINMDNVSNYYALPNNYSSDQINSRCSMDKKAQQNGQILVKICIDNSLCIFNGRNLGDVQGSYTCISPKGISAIDYVLCSHDIMKEVARMAVQPFTQFSDHHPLLLKVHLPTDVSVNSKRPSFTTTTTTTTSRPAHHPNS